MRVVLDTNVVISAVLFGGTPRLLIAAALRGEYDLVTSPALVDELEDVLVRRFGYSKTSARAVSDELVAVAALVEPVAVPTVARDPDDNQVLATAVLGEADYVVTGDADLLDLGHYLGVLIVPPAEAWVVLALPPT